MMSISPTVSQNRRTLPPRLARWTPWTALTRSRRSFATGSTSPRRRRPRDRRKKSIALKSFSCVFSPKPLSSATFPARQEIEDASRKRGSERFEKLHPSGADQLVDLLGESRADAREVLKSILGGEYGKILSNSRNSVRGDLVRTAAVGVLALELEEQRNIAKRVDDLGFFVGAHAFNLGRCTPGALERSAVRRKMSKRNR